MSCTPAGHPDRNQLRSIEPFAVVAITAQPTLRLFASVLPWSAHGPVLIHKAEQVGADALQQGALFHPFNLSNHWRSRHRSLSDQAFSQLCTASTQASADS